MKGPAVSVVMPVFNAERYLAEAVESVLCQTFEDFEFIVVDDGSTDASRQIVAAYAAQDGRIRLFENQDNRGIVAARNQALNRSSPGARYLAIFDADDVCLPERLALQVRFLDHHPEYALVGGNTWIIDEDSRVIAERRYPSDDLTLRRVLTRYNPFAQPTVTVRKTSLEVVGFYDPRYPRCQDYDLWFRLAAEFPVANLNEFTLKYRLSPGQGKATHLKETLRYTLAIQRRWLFDRRFRRLENMATWVLEHGLLLLPDPVIMSAFSRLRYKDSTLPP